MCTAPFIIVAWHLFGTVTMFSLHCIRNVKVCFKYKLHSPHKLIMGVLTTVTNCMELSPSWEAVSCATSQEFLSVLWSLGVQCHVH
jgi:hypothetical protein